MQEAEQVVGFFSEIREFRDNSEHSGMQWILQVKIGQGLNRNANYLSRGNKINIWREDTERKKVQFHSVLLYANLHSICSESLFQMQQPIKNDIIGKHNNKIGANPNNFSNRQQLWAYNFSCKRNLCAPCLFSSYDVFLQLFLNCYFSCVHSTPFAVCQSHTNALHSTGVHTKSSARGKFIIGLNRTI